MISEQKFGERYEQTSGALMGMAATFEAANPDIAQDTEFKGPLFYERFLVPEVKKALVATGKVSPENADRVCGSTIGQALEAYTVALASGQFPVSTPDKVLAAAETAFRARFPVAEAPSPHPHAPLPRAPVTTEPG